MEYTGKSWRWIKGCKGSLQKKRGDGLKEGKGVFRKLSRKKSRNKLSVRFLHLYLYFSELLDNRFRP